jgi:hypothetical protein
VVEATTDPLKIKTFSDTESGDFAVSVPLSREKNDFDLSVTTLAKYDTAGRFSVDIDLSPPEILLDQEPPRIVGGSADSSFVTLMGTIIGGTELRLNGRDVTLSDGRFEEIVELNQGLNTIQLAATDLVGNTTFLVKHIIFDKEAPKLLKYDLSREATPDGERVKIIVFAEDESGMQGTARFTLQAGEFAYTGYLKLYRAMQRYEGIVNLTKQDREEIELDVELRDYHGNTRQYQLK